MNEIYESYRGLIFLIFYCMAVNYRNESYQVHYNKISISTSNFSTDRQIHRDLCGCLFKAGHMQPNILGKKIHFFNAPQLEGRGGLGK